MKQWKLAGTADESTRILQGNLAIPSKVEKLAWVPKDFYSSPIFVIVKKNGNNINVPSGEWLSKHRHSGIFYNEENELELRVDIESHSQNAE